LQAALTLTVPIGARGGFVTRESFLKIVKSVNGQNLYLDIFWPACSFALIAVVLNLAEEDP